MCKFLTVIVLSATVVLTILVALTTLANRNRSFPWDGSNRQDGETFPKLDRERMHQRAERLAKALTIKTISWDVDVFETEALLGLHQHLKESKHACFKWRH